MRDAHEATQSNHGHAKPENPSGRCGADESWLSSPRPIERQAEGHLNASPSQRATVSLHRFRAVTVQKEAQPPSHYRPQAFGRGVRERWRVAPRPVCHGPSVQHRELDAVQSNQRLVIPLTFQPLRLCSEEQPTSIIQPDDDGSVVTTLLLFIIVLLHRQSRVANRNP